MIRNVIRIIATIAIASYNSAGAADPVEYAKQIKKILDERSERVLAEIKERDAGYRDLADILGQAAEDQLSAMGRHGSEQGARELAIDYQTSHRTPRNWRRDLLPYLARMQELQVAALLSDLDAQARFLGAFDGLQADLKKTKQLGKLVDVLAKKRNLKEELQRWYEFGDGTRDRFNEDACKKTKAALESKSSGKTAAETALTTLVSQKAPAGLIAAKQAEVTRLGDDVKSLTAWVKAKGCK